MYSRERILEILRILLYRSRAFLKAYRAANVFPASGVCKTAFSRAASELSRAYCAFSQMLFEIDKKAGIYTDSDPYLYVCWKSFDSLSLGAFRAYHLLMLHNTSYFKLNQSTGKAVAENIVELAEVCTDMALKLCA